MDSGFPLRLGREQVENLGMKSLSEILRLVPPTVLFLIGFGAAIAYGLLRLHAALQAIAH